MEVPLDLGIKLIFHLGHTREQTAGSRGGGGDQGLKGTCLRAGLWVLVGVGCFREEVTFELILEG